MFEQLDAAVRSPSPPASPRVQRVVDRLEKELLLHHWEPGQRIPTVRALASQLGVTCGVAHAAIRHLQATGRLLTRQGSGTFVAARSHAPVSGAVYILMRGAPTSLGPILSPLVLALQQRDLTPIPVVFDPDDHPGLTRLVHRWLAKPPRAVIIKGPCRALAGIVAAAGLTGVRFISTCVLPEVQEWHNVRPDEEKVYYLAAMHLLKHGRRRIGLITHGVNGIPGLGLKREGVERAIAESFPDAQLKIYARTTDTDFARSQPPNDPDVDGVARWLRAEHGPTAVIEHIDRLALLRLATRRAGLSFASDPAVVGVGDPSPGQQGEFPCVSENLDEIARCTINLIVDSDSELNHVARHTIVPPRLCDLEEPV